jgi:hypothetical protein
MRFDWSSKSDSIPKSKVGASISILDFILVGYFEELD